MGWETRPSHRARAQARSSFPSAHSHTTRAAPARDGSVYAMFFSAYGRSPVAASRLCRGGTMQADIHPDSTVLVIFGAGGDLTWRKLIPGLYNLYLDKW